MAVVYRSDHTNLVVTLTSSEPLGILDSDYVEDYFGVDGQLTIYNLGTFDRSAVVMSPLPAETPGVADDVFRGQKAMASLPDGFYEVQGRVRDIAGNYTILSDFESPSGGESTITLGFEITAGVFIPRAQGITKISFSRVSVVSAVPRGHKPSRSGVCLVELSSRTHRPESVRTHGIFN